MTDAVDWEDYWQVGPASASEISQVEESLEIRLPQDVQNALRQHQGMAPVPSMLELFPGRPLVDFGPLFHCREGSDGYIVEEVRALRRRGYPPQLVVLSMSTGGQSHFALDYSRNPAAPTVVYVRPELGYDNARCIMQVAPSFTELLGMLK